MLPSLIDSFSPLGKRLAATEAEVTVGSLNPFRFNLISTQFSLQQMAIDFYEVLTGQLFSNCLKLSLIKPQGKTLHKIKNVISN